MTIRTVLFWFIIALNCLFSTPPLQAGMEFKNSPLVTLPGNNTDYDILTPFLFEAGPIYLTWQNVDEEGYHIYLQCIYPTKQEPVLVYSSTKPNMYPTIAESYSGDGVTIAWQSMIDGVWQILTRTYADSALGRVIRVSNPTTDCITPTLSNRYIGWISDGGLWIKELAQDSLKPVRIDSNGCSNPCLLKNNDDDILVVYEKVDALHKHIYSAELSTFMSHGQQKSDLKIEWLSKYADYQTIDNRNPRFGMQDQITFHSLMLTDSVYKASVPYRIMSQNKSFNVYNPSFLSLPVPCSNTVETPFFMAVDSDSIEGNQEICIIVEPWYTNPEIISISNMAGTDINPTVFLLIRAQRDTVAIIWEHREQGNSQIWMATTPYYPGYGEIENNEHLIHDFKLEQNYPNPFNQSTVIRYRVGASGHSPVHVRLNIYDLQGRLVRRLVNENLPAGNYLTRWDGMDNAGRAVASGIYHYQLKTLNLLETRRMLLVR